MSDFPPTADFFAPHVAASAYRPDSWVSSNVDRPAAEPPKDAGGPVPPPANPPSQYPQDTLVKAEDAPIGVQLWPTIAPEYAEHFTLEAVEVVRRETRRYVRWVYQDGKVREFTLGEEVYCRLPQDEAANAYGPVPPPAKESSQAPEGDDVEPLDDLCTVCGMRPMTLEGHDGMCEVCLEDEAANAYVDELIARNIPPF